MRKGDAVRVIESIEAIRAVFDERVIKQLGYALGQDLADYFEAVTGALENLQIAVQNRVTQPMEERSCATCTKSKALGAPEKARTCVADRLCVEFGEWAPRPTTVKTWTELGPKHLEEMRRSEQADALRALGEMRAPIDEWPTRGEPPETRLTGESPTRDEVPAVGAQTAKHQVSRGCRSCKHAHIPREDEPCWSCTWAPDNQYSKYEPATPASRTAKRPGYNNCWSCKHRSLSDGEEPCFSCAVGPVGFSNHEPLTPVSK